MSEIFAACDVGTSGVRCCLFDIKGTLVTESHRLWRYNPDPAVKNGLMFDPDSAWQLMRSAICEATSSDRIKPADIKAVSMTSQRLGLVLIDSHGKGIKGIPNIDRRAVAEATFISRELGEYIYSSSGRWPGPGHPLSKLLWLKEHEPEIFVQVAHLLSIGDWFIMQLGGQIATDMTSACETCCYDLESCNWNSEITKALLIQASILPEIISSGTVVGKVGKTVSAQTGLPEGALLVMGGGDTEFGILGLGACTVGDAAVITGSSAPIECIVDQPILDKEFRTLTNPFVIQGKWAIESNAMLTGSSYDWLASTFCPPGVSVDHASQFADLELEIATTHLGANDALCYLGSSIMDSRHGNFSASAGIFAPMLTVNGQTLSRGHLARAALEAEAYAIRANISQLEEVTGSRLTALLAGGGSLKSAAFSSILPDVLGIPVMATTDDATPRGCAMCAAKGAGYYKTFEDACTEMALKPRTLEPDLLRFEQYESFYHRWLHGFKLVKNLNLY